MTTRELKELEACWDGLTERQRDMVCEHQRLPTSFWEPRWDELTEWQRDMVCKHQDLPESFWESRWDRVLNDRESADSADWGSLLSECNRIMMNCPPEAFRTKRPSETTPKGRRACGDSRFWPIKANRENQDDNQ